MCKTTDAKNLFLQGLASARFTSGLTRPRGGPVGLANRTSVTPVPLKQQARFNGKSAHFMVNQFHLWDFFKRSHDKSENQIDNWFRSRLWCSFSCDTAQQNDRSSGLNVGRNNVIRRLRSNFLVFSKTFWVFKISAFREEPKNNTEEKSNSLIFYF